MNPYQSPECEEWATPPLVVWFVYWLSQVVLAVAAIGCVITIIGIAYILWDDMFLDSSEPRRMLACLKVGLIQTIFLFCVFVCVEYMKENYYGYRSMCSLSKGSGGRPPEPRE